MSQQTLELEASTRKETGKQIHKVRDLGLIPAVVYGSSKENTLISVEKVPFEKVYKKAGESSLIDLAIKGGEKIKTLIQDVQYDSLTSRILHVDFFRVNMAEKLTTAISLQFEGEAPAVKELKGILVKSLDELEVRCLPSDLVSHFTIDISSLKTFDDAIKVKDIALPKGMEVLHHDLEDVIALVTPPMSEEEYKRLDKEEAPAAVAEVPVVEKKGKSEEAAA